MPLDEEGAKWSCEPCIRGHRSSKCQHFDRLMMKVPKAGRPLAKCPHPKGTCSCQKVYAFMVRIPKGSSCVCRPLYKIPADVKESGQAPQLPQTIPNPPGPTPGPSSSNPNRVQKRGKRQNSTRTLSDNSLKNLADLSAMQTGYTTMSPSVNRFPNLNSPYNLPNSISGTFTSAYEKPASCCTRNNVSTPSSLPMNNPLPSNPQNSTQEENGACCPRKQPTDVRQAPTSCCSKGKGSKTEQHNDGHANIKEEENDGTHGGVSMTSYFAYPQSFSAAGPPAHLGPSNNVPQQFTGLEFQGGHISSSASAPVSGYSSPAIHPQYAGLNQTTTGQCLPNTPGLYPQDYVTIPEDANHNCGCGPLCQCLGCASHPFNETTRQHIQKMGYLMTSRNDDLSAESPGDSTNSPRIEHQYPNGNQGYSNLSINDVASLEQGYDNPYEHFANIPGTTPLATPLQTSHNQNQGQIMMMQPNAYVTVEYPVGLLDPCTNMTGTCQCGANCACIGCLTHHGHNGVPLEPSPPP